MSDASWPDDLCAVLNNGAKLPFIGLGTAKAEGDECVEAVSCALRNGFRCLDTSPMYGTERQVAEGIRRSGVAREKIYVITKLEPDCMSNEEKAYSSVIASLEALDMNYVDLLLMHWPGCWLPRQEKQCDRDSECRKTAWRAMERLYQEGRAKTIGVSNFTENHFNDFLPHVQVLPAVNQVEFHPYMYATQNSLLSFCRKHAIVLQAYSSLGGTTGLDEMFKHPTVLDLAKRHSKTPAQIVLRSTIQRGVPLLVKSANEDRIKEDLAVFDFELSDDDMAALDKISEESGRRFEMDPNKID